MPFISNQGCYESICEDGMLKIIIENATFTCHESGQVIEVALVKDEEWLHEGSIICPSCTVRKFGLFLIASTCLNSFKVMKFTLISQ